MHFNLSFKLDFLFQSFLVITVYISRLNVCLSSSLPLTEVQCATMVHGQLYRSVYQLSVQSYLTHHAMEWLWRQNLITEWSENLNAGHFYFQAITPIIYWWNVRNKEHYVRNYKLIFIGVCTNPTNQFIKRAGYTRLVGTYKSKYNAITLDGRYLLIQIYYKNTWQPVPVDSNLIQ